MPIDREALDRYAVATRLQGSRPSTSPGVALEDAAIRRAVELVYRPLRERGAPVEGARAAVAGYLFGVWGSWDRVDDRGRSVGRACEAAEGCYT